MSLPSGFLAQKKSQRLQESRQHFCRFLGESYLASQDRDPRRKSRPVIVSDVHIIMQHPMHVRDCDLLNGAGAASRETSLFHASLNLLHV